MAVHSAARVFGWTLAAAAVPVAALRVLPDDHNRVQVALEAPRQTVLAAGPLVALAGVLGRAPVLAAVGAALTTELLRDTARPAPGVPRGDGARCRLVTANLLRSNDDVDALAAALLADDPDVLVVQELTAAHAEALDRAGLLDRLPHHLLDPRPDYHGSAVLARWPLTGARVLDVHGYPMAAADVRTPAGPLHVVAVHAAAPHQRGSLPVWRAHLEWLSGYAGRVDTALVLAGDYNATGNHRALRRLLAAARLRDAFTLAGRGPGATWPRWRWLPRPLLRLDHVLVNAPVAVLGARTEASPGSDHHRLVAELVVGERQPRRQAAPAGP